MKKLIFITLLFLQYGKVTAQFYTTGEPPFSIKWSKINTQHFCIIFPDINVKDANKLANLLEHYYPLNRSYMEARLQKKFPVVLHNSSVFSNGYVTMAPRRMELVLTPPQDSYAQDWLSQLTLHESRHVAQLNMINQGFTHVMSSLTGEIAPGIVSAEVPQWLYEGDAVLNETLFSKSGRGRLPGFEMPLRTRLMEDSSWYSYDKAIFGSYRDYVPDHYLYGFQMTYHARLKYGDAIWSDALKSTGKNPFLIWPLTFYLKKHYHTSKPQLYYSTLDSLKNQYNNKLTKITYIDYSCYIKSSKQVYTNYQCPKETEEGNILTMSSGLNDAGSLVLFDTTGRIVMRKATGYNSGVKVDVSKSHVIWDEFIYDHRWGARSYSVLKTMDLNNGRTRRLTKKTMVFSPDFSPDGLLIAVAETDHYNHRYLSILDAANGKVLLQFPFGDKTVLTPEWINNNEVVVITVDEDGKQMEKVDLISGAVTVIIPHTWDNIAEPLRIKDHILFRSSYNGIENIFAINMHHYNNIYQVTYTKYGAYNPAVNLDSTELLFSAYSSSGFEIVKISLNETNWQQVTTRSDTVNTGGPPVTGKDFLLDKDSLILYKSSPYRKALHLFNFHSWLPFYTDIDDLKENPEDIYLTPGIMIFSQNELSTFISSFSYSYDQGYHIIKPVLKWRAWYPVIELTGQIGGPRLSIGLPAGENVPAEPYTEFMIKAYVPLVYNHGSFITYIQPRIDYEWASIWWYTPQSGIKKGLDFIHFKFNISNYKRMAPRDIFPKWGQSLYYAYTKTFADDGLFGNMVSILGAAYLPGILQHHSIIARVGYQVQHPEKYFIPLNRVDFPRGYQSAVSGKFFSLMTNYSFPAGYPDLAMGPFLYLKRLRANIFYDWSYTVDLKKRTTEGAINFTGNYSSYGIEALADFHLFRIIFPFSAGIRLGYTVEYGKPFTEFLLNIETGIF